MRTCRYPSDLIDAEWAILAPLVPAAKPGGRPRKHGVRELLDAMFYLVRAGCAWRLLPWHFPPWKTVYHYLRGAGGWTAPGSTCWRCCAPPCV